MSTPTRPLGPYLRAALFCASAGRDAQGRLNVQGIFTDRTYDQHMPPGLKVGGILVEAVAFLVVMGVEEGAHDITCRWFDERGDPCETTLSRPLPVGPAGKAEGCMLDFETALLVSPPRSGLFEMAVEVDGVVIGWVPLRVTCRTTEGLPA